MSNEQEVLGTREAVRSLMRDSVTKMLLGHSQLTPAQLETLLTDSLSQGGEIRKSQRRLYRPSKARISRGAYNRTLIQAQNNVIRSIYTILLLGYLELFDSSSLQPFLELSDTIDSFVKEAKQTSPTAIEELRVRLLEFATALARRKSFRDAL